MPNFVHLLLTRAGHTMNVLKVHEHEQEEVVVVLDLLVEVISGCEDV